MFIYFLQNENNSLRKLYKKISKIKSIVIIKQIIIHSIFYILKRRMQKLKLISIEKFISAWNINKLQLINSTCEIVPNTHFYKQETFLTLPTNDQYNSPESTIYVINNAIIMARTDFLIYKKQVIYSPNFDPSEHISTVEQLKIGTVIPSKKVIKLKVVPTLTLDYGISLLGEGSGNYAHFLFETIPKLLLIDSKDLYRDFPLIIDGWIGKHLIDILIYFNHNEREIIKLREWEQCVVKKLGYITSPCQGPQDFRSNYKPNLFEKPKIPQNSYKFNSDALRSIHNYVIKKNGFLNVKKDRFYLIRGKKIVKGKQYNQRFIWNEDEIIIFLKKYDFYAVNTAKLSFKSQVELFSRAEIVIAPFGAALANLIFAPKNCSVIGLVAYYKNVDYSYYVRLMAALDHDLKIVLGSRVIELNTHPMHSKYTISINTLETALNDII